MELLLESFKNIVELDQNYVDIVVLSLYVSIFATLLSGILSIILAGYISISSFMGKETVIIAINSLMSLPPVVVGLVLYIIFSASGVLGFMDILYSPTIMILAQLIIVTPIIMSLLIKCFTDKYQYLNELLLSLNANKYKMKNTIIYEARYDVLIAFITGLSRALSEVGAVIIVGGNIDNLTRVMTTSIVLETSRGELSLALSLGISLIIIALILNIFILILRKKFLHE